LRVGLLEVAAADLARREVRGDAEHRYARTMTIEQPVNEVQVTGPATARAYRELAR
jgi:predicted outer membrane protein